MARDDLPTDELLRIVLEAYAADVHTAMPGVVTKYDAAKKRADVRPGVRALRPGVTQDGYEALPVIPNVPVGWPGAGGFFQHWPLAAGDSGWLFFSEADVQRWQETGEVSDPREQRRHTLGSPLFLPIPRVPPSAVGAFMACPSAFSFGNPALAQALARADKVEAELNSLKQVFSMWAPVPNDGGGTLKTAVSSWAGTPADVGAAKVKAE